MKRFIYSIIFIFFISSSIYAIKGTVVVSTDFNYPDQYNRTVAFYPNAPAAVKDICADQFFNCYLLFEDYALDASKKAHITFDIKITDSKKQVVFEQSNLLGVNDTVSYKTNVQLAKDFINTSLPANAATGNYMVTVIVNDLIANTTETVTSNFNVAKYKSGVDFKNKDAFVDWKTFYYQKPDPSRIINAYLYFATNDDLNTKENIMWGNMYFFMQLFNYNPHLIAELISVYPKQELKTKIYIIFLLHYLDRQSTLFFNSLQGDEKDTYNKIREQGMPFNLGTFPESGEHLDVLWSCFMATGKFSFIRDISKTLKWTSYTGSIDKYKQSQAEADYENAYKEAVYKAASWSLSANSKTHPLVRNYILYMVTSPELEQDVKMELTLTLL